MFKKLLAATLDQKIFIGITLLLVLAFILLYFFNLFPALTMDKNSYECIEDSMMKIICNDPYGSSVTWALIMLTVIGWPVLIAWLVSGVAVVTHYLYGKYKTVAGRKKS